MQKVTTPHLPQDDKYIFTEGINYHETGTNSIWGSEDETTVKAITKTPVKGRWLNVCAGDGRFSGRLLEKADEVVALDIDESALSKLRETTRKDLRKKLVLCTGNVTEQFPFEDNSFDVVFCTGTLHLFPEKVLRRITSEIDRVLRPYGRVILDYATDIKREMPDGTLYLVDGEPNSTLDKGIRLLKSCFPNYQTSVETSVVAPEEVVTPKYRYVFSSNFFLFTGQKPALKHS